MRSLKLAVCLSLGAMSAGCASNHSQPLSISDVKSSMNGFGQIDKVLTSELYVKSLPDGDWWSIFNDGNLNQLESELPSSSLDMQLQLSHYVEMASRYDISGSSLKPSVGVNASYSRSGLSADDPLASLGMPTDPFDTWNLGVSAQWELDLWGYLNSQNESVHHQLIAEKYLVESAKQSLSAELARRYMLYRQSMTDLTLLQDKVDIEKKKVDLSLSRQNNGVGTKSQTATAKANYESVLATLDAAKLAIDINQSELEKLLGMSPSQLTQLRTQFQSVEEAKLPQLPIGIPSESLRMRPDILAAEQTLRSTLSDVAAAKANFYPRISLTGSLGVQSIDFSDLGSWDSRQFSIGPTFYLPIFQGGRLEATLALTNAKSKTAAIRYRKVVLDAWHEVSNAMKSYTLHVSNVQHMQDSLLSYQKAEDAALSEHNQGVISQIELLTAQEKVINAKVLLQQAKTALCLDVIAVYRALGIGTNSDNAALANNKVTTGTL